ncbi:MAG TPA: DUF4157 domain-containing protein [Acidimicrobiia bacterium]|nr:DUF4157 domain-containing protein [Acidimicrobiia bacterium]
MLDLQAAAGNRATARVSRSLVVGSAGDRAEREADALAGSALARLGIGDVVHRSAGMPSGAEVGLAGGGLSPRTAHAVQAARASGGRPLDSGTRSAMEEGLGRSLPSVRVHTGPVAGDLTRRLGASAFTVGRDVFLGPGHDDASTPEGSHALAHELAHTTQPASSDGGASAP